MPSSLCCGGAQTFALQIHRRSVFFFSFSFFLLVSALYPFAFVFALDFCTFPCSAVGKLQFMEASTCPRLFRRLPLVNLAPDGNFRGARLNRPRFLQMLSLPRHSGLMDADEKCPLETNGLGSAFGAEAYHPTRVNPRDDDFSAACHH